jgi:hypothetical protein
MWPLFLLVLAYAKATTIMVDADGNPTAFATRPLTIFRTCVEGNLEVADVHWDYLHIGLFNAKTGVLVKSADIDQLEPHILPLRSKQRNCAEFGILTWSMWHKVFGLAEDAEPEDWVFQVHSPVQLLEATDAPLQASVNASPNVQLRFQCTHTCRRTSELSSADVVAAWVFIGLFLVLVFVCIGVAMSYPMEPFTVRVVK